MTDEELRAEYFIWAGKCGLHVEEIAPNVFVGYDPNPDRAYRSGCVGVVLTGPGPYEENDRFRFMLANIEYHPVRPQLTALEKFGEDWDEHGYNSPNSIAQAAITKPYWSAYGHGTLHLGKGETPVEAAKDWMQSYVRCAAYMKATADLLEKAL